MKMLPPLANLLVCEVQLDARIGDACEKIMNEFQNLANLHLGVDCYYLNKLTANEINGEILLELRSIIQDQSLFFQIFMGTSTQLHTKLRIDTLNNSLEVLCSTIAEEGIGENTSTSLEKTQSAVSGFCKAPPKAIKILAECMCPLHLTLFLGKRLIKSFIGH